MFRFIKLPRKIEFESVDEFGSFLEKVYSDESDMDYIVSEETLKEMDEFVKEIFPEE